MSWALFFDKLLGETLPLPPVPNHSLTESTSFATSALCIESNRIKFFLQRFMLNSHCRPLCYICVPEEHK
ncbi:hypothetical protein Y1Q_0014150 [Alligator mississippiensis]|uniref:Uncharacterized protein n=1 Tax=Alligator mississippiensis TaxID=8496 RepID=A0A151MTU9_ALLMI|nr:hypothetical protein Y1Q_0014150 [Alligator mississippiensis]